MAFLRISRNSFGYLLVFEIHLSGNFRGYLLAVPTAQRKFPRNISSSVRNLPTVASQRAAGEKILPPNSQIMSKSEIFRVPLRFIGSGIETGIDIF